MDYIDHQRVPDDVYALNKTLLWTANHHFPYFAPNQEIQLMIAECENNLDRALKLDKKGEALHLNRRIAELEPHSKKLFLSHTTAQGEIQLYDMRMHYRECMQNLLAHFAVTHTWNQTLSSPWEDRLRMNAANYLESIDGTQLAGQAFYDFNTKYKIRAEIRHAYIDARDQAIDLLRK